MSKQMTDKAEAPAAGSLTLRCGVCDRNYLGGQSTCFCDVMAEREHWRLGYEREKARADRLEAWKALVEQGDWPGRLAAAESALAEERRRALEGLAETFAEKARTYAMRAAGQHDQCDYEEAFALEQRASTWRDAESAARALVGNAPLAAPSEFSPMAQQGSVSALTGKEGLEGALQAWKAAAFRERDLLALANEDVAVSHELLLAVVGEHAIGCVGQRCGGCLECQIRSHLEGR